MTISLEWFSSNLWQPFDTTVYLRQYTVCCLNDSVSFVRLNRHQIMFLWSAGFAEFLQVQNLNIELKYIW